MIARRDEVSVVLIGQHHWRPDQIDQLSICDYVRALVATDTYNGAMAAAMAPSS